MKQNSIGMTTCSHRLEKYLKPLIAEIKKQRPNIEIVLAINGEHKKDFDEQTRQEFLKFCQEFPNIFPIFYPKFRGLARLWNLNMQFSSNRYMFFLEDDVIMFDGFFDEYESILESTEGNFMINKGFPFFSFDREVLNKCNWFDERFIGHGFEDADIWAKYRRTINNTPCRIMDGENYHSFPNFNLTSIKHIEKIQGEVRLVNQRIETLHNRHNQFNNEVLDVVKNTQQVTQYPYEKFYWDNIDNL
jgi:hypothetical protein